MKEGKIKRLKDSEINKIKSEILGKQYELSFAFISKNKIKELNNRYRKINKATDVLSFPLEKNNGEILICKEIAKQKSKNFNLTSNNYLLFLVIHGMLHLKGYSHGSSMEKLENKYYKKFK